jgi:hypothetical protein
VAVVVQAAPASDLPETAGWQVRGISSSLHAVLSREVDAQGMANVKTWLASAALVGGASGGALGVAAASGPATAGTPQPPRQASTSEVSGLQQQVAALVADERALATAIRAARVRLAGQVAVSEHSLNAALQRLERAQAELAQIQAARTALLNAPAAQQQPPVSRAQPQTHTTTGASGAGGSSDDGGGDD